jgi:hypothetical protein
MQDFKTGNFKQKNKKFKGTKKSQRTEFKGVNVEVVI